MANARSRIAFQVTGKDARELASLTRGQLDPDDFETLPAFHAYAQLLANNQPAGWVSLTTRPLPPPLRPPSHPPSSRSQPATAKPISDVEADLLKLLDAPGHRASDEPIGRARRHPPTSNDSPRDNKKGGSS
ncbi:MAG: hypothetical protein V9G13_08020 [Marmoricola sp.]